MKTSTPEHVPEVKTRPLGKFCASLRASDTLLIDVIPQEWATFNNCYPNVLRMVEEHRGRALNGWKILHWPRVWFHAVHHCVWQKPDGTVIDPTPQENGALKTFFARCDDAVFDSNKLALRRDVYKPLWSHRNLARLIGVIGRRDKLLQKGVSMALDPASGMPIDPEVRKLLDETRPLWIWVAKHRK